MDMRQSLIGTAGWSVSRTASGFAPQGSALERYGAVFSAVEVNSSFYRRHRPATWQRWHDAVPEGFRFSVKLPKTITHERRLVGAEGELDGFFEDVLPLGRKLGALLLQLPPKLEYEPVAAERFLAALRQRSGVPAFIEPRHASWAAAEVSEVLGAQDIGRVYADPQQEPLRAAALAEPARYLRLHGAPRIYYSAYGEAELRRYADLLSASETPAWCIFDNTAAGAALDDALRLRAMMG